MIDEHWNKVVADGRQAFADGKTDADCPYHGRSAAAWLTGRREAFAETDEAKTNEKVSLRAALQQAVETGAAPEVVDQLKALVAAKRKSNG